MIRLSSIGDIVLTSLSIRCIRNAYPDIQIDFLTKPQYVTLVSSHMRVDNVLTLSDSLWDGAQMIVDEGYDAVFDLHAVTKTRILRQLLPVEIPFYQYEKKSFQRTWSVFAKKDHYGNSHVSEQYLKLFEPWGVVNDGKGLDFFIPDHQWVYRTDLPLTHRSGYAVLSLGATHFTKKLPIEKWEQIIQRLNIPLILIGGKEEVEMGKRLEALDDLKVINKCGIFSIGQSASVMAQSKFVITHDTGMMHIAAALQAKVISIWGGTVPYLGFSPYALPVEKNHIIEVQGLSCRPCSKYGRSSCPKGHFRCMWDISVEEVVRAGLGNVI